MGAGEYSMVTLDPSRIDVKFRPGCIVVFLKLYCLSIRYYRATPMDQLKDLLWATADRPPQRDVT
jgi:hypothetical protein